MKKFKLWGFLGLIGGLLAFLGIQFIKKKKNKPS
jgi:hypothetical protein